MGARDTRHEFDEIVGRLTADYPSLARTSRWPRPVLIAMLSVGGVVWGLLSVAMVAWGWRGVVLTCAVVAATGVAIAVDNWRWRR
jgi:hypothetical protein